VCVPYKTIASKQLKGIIRLGIFRSNHNKPITGYKKDGPRKRGSSRFFEILVRDFWDLIKLNLMFCICVLPSISLFLLGLFGIYPIAITLTLSIVFAFPLGGVLTAYVFRITMMLRDEPSGGVWYECKRKFIENFKQAAPAGMVCTAIIYAQIMLWGLLLQDESGYALIWVFVTVLTMLLFFMITPYMFMQFAYVSLNTLQIIKNSILMAFASFLRSLMGALLGCLMWVLLALYFPLSMRVVPVVFLIGISLSILLCLMWVWPQFDKAFKIEETLLERKKEKGIVDY